MYLQRVRWTYIGPVEPTLETQNLHWRRFSYIGANRPTSNLERGFLELVLYKDPRGPLLKSSRTFIQIGADLYSDFSPESTYLRTMSSHESVVDSGSGMATTPAVTLDSDFSTRL